MKSYQDAPEELKKRTSKDLVKKKATKNPARKPSNSKPRASTKKSTITGTDVVKPPRNYAIGTPRAKPPPTINYVPGTPPKAINSRIEIIKPVSPPSPEEKPVVAKKSFLSSSPWDPDVMVTVILSTIHTLLIFI